MRTVLLAIAIAALPWMSAAAKTTVKVEQGLLDGTVEQGLTVYRGIPFAAPPVGDLRWHAPQPAVKWDGVRHADKFAPECVQGGLTPRGQEAPAMSEDCLYLNVWTLAKLASSHIPVLVWLYGGGFSAGAISVSTYSGEILARKGVVLVSIAYRLGPIGFMAHPELSAESPQHVSGNYGLLDMIAGLQWIQKNIDGIPGPHAGETFDAAVCRSGNLGTIYALLAGINLYQSGPSTRIPSAISDAFEKQVLSRRCASPKLHPAKKLIRRLDILTVKSRLDRPTRASWKAMKTKADGILARHRLIRREFPRWLGTRHSLNR